MRSIVEIVDGGDRNIPGMFFPLSYSVLLLPVPLRQGDHSC